MMKRKYETPALKVVEMRVEKLLSSSSVNIQIFEDDGYSVEDAQ